MSNPLPTDLTASQTRINEALGDAKKYPWFAGSYVGIPPGGGGEPTVVVTVLPTAVGVEDVVRGLAGGTRVHIVRLANLPSAGG